MNNVFLQTDLFHIKAAFVIKQKKLLHCFNMRDLIETNKSSTENWTVNHGVPVRLSILKQSVEQILADNDFLSMF